MFFGFWLSVRKWDQNSDLIGLINFFFWFVDFSFEFDFLWLYSRSPYRKVLFLYKVAENGVRSHSSYLRYRLWTKPKRFYIKISKFSYHSNI